MAEAWLINMNKYFQVYEYNRNLKARLAIYKLREKATLWWEEVKNVRSIDEQDITWEFFSSTLKENTWQKYFMLTKLRNFII